MRAILISILVAGLPSAVAPERAPAVVYDLVLGAGGAAGSGRETVREVRDEEGSRLEGTAEIDTPSGSLRLEQVARLTPRTGRTIVSYDLVLRAGEHSGSLRVTPSQAGWTLAAAQVGATGEPQIRELLVEGVSFILDQYLPSHVDVLTRGLTLAPGAELVGSAVIPQSLAAAPLLIQRIEDGAGTYGGAPVRTRRYRLTLAATLVEVEARHDDGALLYARVPLQEITFTRSGFVPSPRSAPVISSDDPREKPVTVAGPAVGLPAVLIVPASTRPVPAVVFLQDSGPQDRDGTIGANKPLRDLARGLADRGIASLRYDKRTWVKRDPGVAPDLRAEYLLDAGAALQLVRERPGVDPRRVFVIGHSLGATVAPLAARDASVRGLVLLAPMVRRVDEVLLDQIPAELKARGVDAETIASRRERIRAYFESLRSSSADPGPFLGASSGYWRDLLALDLPALIRGATIPVLALQGGKDVLVRERLDFEALRREVGPAGGRVQYRLFPELNHIFVRVQGTSTGAENALPGQVDPAVAEAIAAWIQAH